MLYQFLLDDVARKQITPEQLKKMQKGEEVEDIENRRTGNSNININKSHLIRTMSTKTPQHKPEGIQLHNMARTLRDEDDTERPPMQGRPQVTFGASVEREPLSATSTDSKRLTM